MILFSNPGCLDPRLITIQGASIKETSHPIGRFGTGFKNAIAGILRLGQEIVIFSGETRLDFSVRHETIRGVDVPLVFMKADDDPYPTSCGFTAFLGQHWEPWMLYRELYANALDEGGEIEWISGIIEPQGTAGRTRIFVTGPVFDDIWENRDDYFLSSKPLWTLPNVLEVHPVGPSLVCYQGIRMATKIAGAETSAFTYNLLGNHKLTEDRTLADEYSARTSIAKALLQCEDKELLGDIFRTEAGLERALDYHWISQKPCKVFVEVALERIRRKEPVPQSAKDLLRDYAKPELEKAEETPPAGDWEAMLEEAPPEPASILTGEASIYIRSLETAYKDALASSKYWKRCAKALAKNEQGRELVQASHS